MLSVYPAHQQAVIVGNAVLNCGASEVLEVIQNPTDGINDRRIIVMRTDSPARPLIDLATGELWENNLTGFVFVHVNATKMTLD